MTGTGEGRWLEVALSWLAGPDGGPDDKLGADGGDRHSGWAGGHEDWLGMDNGLTVEAYNLGKNSSIANFVSIVPLVSST